MSEQSKFEEMIYMFSKVIHPDLYSQIPMQYARAKNEYEDEIKKKLSGSKLLELEPMLLEYQNAGARNLPGIQNMIMKNILKKINELYGK